MNKPIAKCKYCRLCTLYNNGILSEEIEIEMCGKGFATEGEYVPEIPSPDEFHPVEGYESDPGGRCDAFTGYEGNEVIKEMGGLIQQLQGLLEERGYW